MGDFASTIAKVKPGEKVYLFHGPPSGAVDHLQRLAVGAPDYLQVIRPPLSADDLAIVFGTSTETTVTVLREMDRATEAEWQLVADHLRQPKAPGRSLIIVADELPDLPVVKDLRSRVSRQGVLVEVKDPTGDLGRRNLIQWVLEEWHTTKAVATEACARCDYSISALVWATRVFLALSSGQPIEGSRAQRLMQIAVPVTATAEAFRLLMSRDPRAVEATRRLTPDQSVALLHQLEAALTDLLLLHPVLSAGHSVKNAAAKTGIHLVRVLDLAEWTPRYPPGVVDHCRRVLDLALANPRQPEVASTVAILWS